MFEATEMGRKGVRALVLCLKYHFAQYVQEEDIDG